ncbi:MAG: hypothetical protein WKF71_09410 [Pyrinomonadaceae bacterium]
MKFARYEADALIDTGAVSSVVPAKCYAATRFAKAMDKELPNMPTGEMTWLNLTEPITF